MSPEFPGAERMTTDPESLERPEDLSVREEFPWREALVVEESEMAVALEERPEEEEMESDEGPALALKVPTPVL